MNPRVALLSLFLMLSSESVFCQQQVITIESIVSMVQAGISEEVITARLRKEGKAFDLSPDEIIRLKKANVSDNVVRVMMDPRAEISTSSSSTLPRAQLQSPVVVQSPILAAVSTVNPSGATPTGGSIAAGDPNNPMTPHDSGIYLYTKDREGKSQMIVLERAAYQGAKTGGILTSTMTYGIKKAKMKAVIPGPRASIRVSDPSPVFYFYFDDKAAGLGKSYFGIGNLSNPNQFALLKLEVNKANRETIIGQFGAFGSSSGTDDKAMKAFKSERLRPGLYKVVVEGLQAGEYCFLASSGALGVYGAGASGAADIFDFGYASQ